MAIFKLDEHTPTIDSSAWVADSAQIIGKVQIHSDASIWPGAVLRGDLSDISIGQGTNVQDNAVIHTEITAPCTVEEHVTVGHGAVLHGCTVQSGALIGMGATVLNHAVIGKDAVVGAGALVSEGKIVEARSLVVGCPARFVRFLTDEEIQKNRSNTQSYTQKKELYRTKLQRLD